MTDHLGRQVRNPHSITSPTILLGLDTMLYRVGITSHHLPGWAEFYSERYDSMARRFFGVWDPVEPAGRPM